MEQKIIFKIIDRKTGKPQGVYDRAYRNTYEFYSPEEARMANVHDIYQDREKYRIAKYKVTYELIEEDC